MNTPKVFFLVLLLMCVVSTGLGQDNTNGTRKTFNINGTDITSYVPREMNVTLTPYRIETSNEMSMLFYKISVTGKETVYGLHWYVYVSDSGGKLIHKDSWWDRGERGPNSEVDENTVFEYKNLPGTKLTIILQEAISNTGVRSISLRDSEQLLTEIIAGNGAGLPQAKFVAHSEISPEDKLHLIKRSLNAILANTELRQNLMIKDDKVLILTDDPNKYNDISNVKPVSDEQIKNEISKGKSIDYLEYCCMEVLGESIRVIFNYHTPTINGNLYIRKGARIKLSYYKKHGQLVLKDVNTEHY